MDRKFFFTALLFGMVFLAAGQKKIDKTVEPNGDKVIMKFDFATKIVIEAWANKTIGLSVSANIDNNQYNDFYSLDVAEKAGKVNIVEKVDFEGIKAKKGTSNMCNFETEINYTLKVPEGLKFDLNTISGEIELKGCKGEMDIESVSGFIDYSVPATHKAKIDLSTVTGDVYSDLKFDQPPKKEITWVGLNHTLSLNGGSIPVELNTVSGNIFLRKL